MSALAPRWFLVLNGVALLLMGGALLVMRLRQPGPILGARRLFGLTWALLCLCVGGALLLMATGRLDQPGQAGQARQRAPARRTIEFPTDR